MLVTWWRDGAAEVDGVRQMMISAMRQCWILNSDGLISHFLSTSIGSIDTVLNEFALGFGFWSHVREIIDWYMLCVMIIKCSVPVRVCWARAFSLAARLVVFRCSLLCKGVSCVVGGVTSSCLRIVGKSNVIAPQRG